MGYNILISINLTIFKNFSDRCIPTVVYEYENSVDHRKFKELYVKHMLDNINTICNNHVNTMFIDTTHNTWNLIRASSSISVYGTYWVHNWVLTIND